MKNEYDLKRMKRIPNPYVQKLKKEVSLRLGTDVITYFTSKSNETGRSISDLIDSYLRRKIVIEKLEHLKSEENKTPEI